MAFEQPQCETDIRGSWATGLSSAYFASCDRNLTMPLRRIMRSAPPCRVFMQQRRQMMLRWVAAGVLDAVKGFRRVKGCADMSCLVTVLRVRAQRLGIGGSVANVA